MKGAQKNLQFFNSPPSLIYSEGFTLSSVLFYTFLSDRTILVQNKRSFNIQSLCFLFAFLQSSIINGTSKSSLSVLFS